MKQYFSILAALFLSASASTLNAQNVNIPDPVFKNALIGSAVNTNFDSEIQLSEAQSFTGGINLLALNITDLTGLEEFINITELECRATAVSTLDLSANSMLTNLRCGSNLLTSLDISNNINLTHLICQTSPLTSLDISNNINLTHLDCTSIDITHLDLSNNVNLVTLDFRSDSLLETVNLKNGNNTAITTTDFQGQWNPALTCIEVDDVSYSTANWTNIDSASLFSANCFLNFTETNNISNLQAYPNPTQNTLTLDLGTMHASIGINITNTIGQSIQSTNYTNIQTLDLNLEGLPGWYFIQIQTKKGSRTIKVLKQ